MLEDNLVSQSRRMGDILLRKLKNLDHPIIGDVRGLGLFTGIEFVKDRRTRNPSMHGGDANLATHSAENKAPATASCRANSGFV